MLTPQEKWDRLKEICQHWHAVVQGGETMLDYKKLLSDRGFLVHATQAYPSMKPYLKGFHLSLETWRGNCDAEGWEKRNNSPMDNELEKGTACSLEDVKLQALCQDAGDLSSYCKEPPSGKTTVVPRFKQDLEALLLLTKSKHPTVRHVRSNLVVTAYYGFGDASLGGFGLMVERPDGLHGRFGLWGSDTEDESLNNRELCNLVEMVEEEALNSHLSNLELWIFTNNSTAESCFFKGGSSFPLLHKLVLRLRKVKLEQGFLLHMVHVAGTLMIAQGTDGLSRGIYLEGVMAGDSMLSFINLAKSALE